ncbi:M15 family metallopeptidase [Mammaliicoccus sciuri]|uniref:M15 family metallopeptidase n=1 Tax=Mammaliicoccus sciuri TaxID=1296 RepID=UPI0034DD7917
MILMGDKRIRNVGFSSSDEKLISLRGINNKIFIDESMSQINNTSQYFCYAREAIFHKLKIASEKLPKNYSFLIKEAYRPPHTQENSFKKVYDFNKKHHPNLSESSIYDLTCEYVAPLETAGHCTGGAIDITLQKNGSELNMGTLFNESPVPPENKTYTNSIYITDEARKNRDILIGLMKDVGFVNYPTEWWHFSYGDKYWAFFNDTDAIYNSMLEVDINN